MHNNNRFIVGLQGCIFGEFDSLEDAILAINSWKKTSAIAVYEIDHMVNNQVVKEYYDSRSNTFYSSCDISGNNCD
jgi:hypothetical protein